MRAAAPGAELVVVGAEGRDGGGVAFTGRVDESDKRALLGEAAVFCAPNLGGESFGITLVEAMAAGCAVVASGLPAFVHVGGDAARYVSPGDAPGLASALVALLGGDDARQQLSAAALARVRRFDAGAVAAAYIGAYERALALAG